MGRCGEQQYARKGEENGELARGHASSPDYCTGLRRRQSRAVSHDPWTDTSNPPVERVGTGWFASILGKNEQLSCQARIAFEIMLLCRPWHVDPVSSGQQRTVADRRVSAAGQVAEPGLPTRAAHLARESETRGSGARQHGTLIGKAT